MDRFAAFLFCLVTVVCAIPATSESSMSLVLDPNVTEDQERVSISGSLYWDGPTMLTDLYLVVMDESFSIRFVRPNLQLPLECPTPYINRLTIPEGYSITGCCLESHQVWALAFSEIPGDYTLILALVESGTLNLVDELAVARLEVYPSPRIWEREWGYRIYDRVRMDYVRHEGLWHLKEASIVVPLAIQGGSSPFQGEFVCEMTGDWELPKNDVATFYESGSRWGYTYSMRVSVYPDRAELWGEVSYKSGGYHGNGWRETCLP